MKLHLLLAIYHRKEVYGRFACFSLLLIGSYWQFIYFEYTMSLLRPILIENNQYKQK